MPPVAPMCRRSSTGSSPRLSTPHAATCRIELRSQLSQQKEKSKLPKPERFKALLPDVWQLVRPRRALLAWGFVLMAINRTSGLVLPYSTKYLVDDIIGKRQAQFLLPLVLAVLCATAIQGVTSFYLT